MTSVELPFIAIDLNSFLNQLCIQFANAPFTLELAPSRILFDYLPDSSDGGQGWRQNAIHTLPKLNCA